MPTTELREDSKNAGPNRPEKLNALIGQQVIHALGEPRDLLKLQVRPLWENYYRVNVFLGKDAASARIDGSYFLTADGDGNIVASTPQIVKRY